MNIALRISILIGIMIYMAVIIFFLKRKRIILKYSLLWILSAIVLIIMDVFPGLVEKTAHLLGIEYSVNAIFLIFIFIILLILVSLTAIVSKQHSQIKVLTQKLAILAHEHETEKNMSESNKDKT